MPGVINGDTTVTNDRLDELLRKVPTSRRKVLKGMLIGAFVVPMVTSFPMDGRLSNVALAQVGNSTTS